MTHPSRWITVPLLALAPAGGLLGQEPVGDLSAALEDVRTRHDLPALVAAVASSDGLLAEGVAGVRDVSAPDPATLQDLWHIGSVTKSFTSTLAARLVEEGRLSWDAGIGEYLAAARGTPFESVPISALASHSSGLPPNPPQPWLMTARMSEDSYTDQRLEVVAEALSGPPQSEPGTTFLYSNLGYMALGAVIEGATGRTWEELLRRYVLDPLGLESAGFGAPGSTTEIDQPRGHVRGSDGQLRPVPGLDNPAALGPAGTLHMSIRDLASYAVEHLRGELGEGTLLEAESYRRLHAGGLGDYGMGWVDQTDEQGRRMIWHNGSNTAWYALVTFYPELDRAFVIVSNGSIEARAAVHETLEELVGQWGGGGALGREVSGTRPGPPATTRCCSPGGIRVP
jgi:CubicO group peptidase (beta-lactamase class C family)